MKTGRHYFRDEFLGMILETNSTYFWSSDHLFGIITIYLSVLGDFLTLSLVFLSSLIQKAFIGNEGYPTERMQCKALGNFEDGRPSSPKTFHDLHRFISGLWFPQLCQAQSRQLSASPFSPLTPFVSFPHRHFWLLQSDHLYCKIKPEKASNRRKTSGNPPPLPTMNCLWMKNSLVAGKTQCKLKYFFFKFLGFFLVAAKIKTEDA